ncbi:hypothetical protein GKD24_08345 [Lactobacillus paracasei]|jgi:hypothetical protein|uniref:Uncharacterized protein n=13 Tax=Lacticaseibacillus paracasei TaxID=1597 RepID=Q03BG9_LACP3|nr:hypothetical protein LSEI_0611 [Lacticaseibacillus paracasei ATCC 334]ADK17815.1 hypothetical protein LCAZH_0525 [Lacticaseibacillus paracasei]AHJ32025.1 hypothetical protein AF91_02060 [Lacticaseibacillus paracasei N1115]AUC00068.1 hypothetical protein BBD24_03365 [Lacticaseibacillus paracasei subsp. paracasei]AZP98018.1 hypothetical protein CYL78_03760 [Lacticaseibacillus paracasei subsp. tolerans]EKQ01539.1 hypothetical protein LCA12A_2493 [Lacticaseibacillus casei 12A]EKQ04247.1 hypoth
MKKNRMVSHTLITMAVAVLAVISEMPIHVLIAGFSRLG